MGRASSAKKVARAARAAGSGGGRSGERRAIGFPALVAVVVVLGLVLVAFARANRDTEVAPRLTDHWHSAYQVYDCVDDRVLPVFTSTFDPVGIHSHQDGLIHIHPFTSAVTGRGAQLEVFMSAMAADITDDYIELPGGERLEAGVECDGQEAIIQVLRWGDAFSANNSRPTDVYTDNVANVVFKRNGEAFVIARAPLGFDPPQFPQSQLQLLRDAMGTPVEPFGTIPTPVPGAPGLTGGLAPPDQPDQDWMTDDGPAEDGTGDDSPADEPDPSASDDADDADDAADPQD